jgi:hypothetical protein
MKSEITLDCRGPPAGAACLLAHDPHGHHAPLKPNGFGLYVA